MNNILDIKEAVNFDESIIDYEWHSHNPYNSNSFNNGDEIRIPIHQTDIYTLPNKSFILIEGKVVKIQNDADDTTTELVNNAAAYFFEEIRYEICGTEVDRVKNVGITSTIKNILTARPGDANWMNNAGWNILDLKNQEDKTKFSFCIPLKLLLGFVEDYGKILLNVKQELVLLRSSSDKNAIIQEAAALHDFKIKIDKLIWKMPYIRVDDEVKLSLLKVTDSDQYLQVPFRRWQLHEYPSLPITKFLTWTIKTASMIEKPRYVIVAFQTGRKDQSNKNASHFDFCDLENIKLYLNSKYYPYDNINGNKSLLYEGYSRFQSSFYAGSDDQPCISKSNFLSKCPMYVVDCSKQVDTLKTGTLDVRIEIQTSANFPANTAAYCLIIYDALIQYSPLSGIVKKIM